MRNNAGIGLHYPQQHRSRTSLPTPPTRTWLGGARDGIWSNHNNWQDGIMPSEGDVVVFADTAAEFSEVAVCVDLFGVSISSIIFSELCPAMCLYGNTVVIGSVTNLSNKQQTLLLDIEFTGEHTFATNAGELSLLGNLFGIGRLVKTGHHTLRVGEFGVVSRNTYSGGTTILDGTLRSGDSDNCFGTGEIALNGANATLMLLCANIHNNITNNVPFGRVVLGCARGGIIDGNITANANLLLVPVANKYTVNGRLIFYTVVDIQALGHSSELVITSVDNDVVGPIVVCETTKLTVPENFPKDTIVLLCKE